MIGPSRLHMPKALATTMRDDLARPRRIAAERVGIVLVRYASVYATNVIVVVGYEPAPDVAYVKGRAAANFDVRWLMTSAEKATEMKCGVLWAHLHEHSGSPRFSPTDMQTSRSICPALWLACPRFPQGALVLSDNQASALIVSDRQRLKSIDVVREIGRIQRTIQRDGEGRG